MSFVRFSNSDEIIKTNSPVYGLEYTTTDLDLLEFTVFQFMLSPEQNPDLNYAVELHVYSKEGELINAVYDVNFATIPDVQQSLQHLRINLQKEFERLNISRGTFKIVINYHQNWLGNHWNAPLFISEIAPDRTELKLSLGKNISSVDSLKNPNITLQSNIQLLKQYVSYISTSNIIKFSPFAVNLGSNNIFKIVNIKFDDKNNVYVKLYNPLPDEFEEKSRLWLISENINPYVDNINLTGVVPEKQFNTLKGANFDLDFQYGTSTETDFKTWNQLLDTTTSTSQQIIDRYFSGSIDEIGLGIDFTDYKNFIHYSSAVERLSNFKFKLELIEYYDQQLSLLNRASGSDSGSLQNNISTNTSRKNNVVGGFDSFERWLYNEPTSSLFTHGISGSLTPWPKYLQSGSWKLHHTTSSLGTNWYNGNIQSASMFDNENENALIKYIPESIRIDDNNDQFMLFVNMIGHHYDILWSYINKLTATYTVEEHPKLGVSKELLNDVASSLGWQLVNGKQADQLWQYKLGTTSSGSYQSTGSMFSKSSEDLTHEVWRRIVNNMPYILKTKGTARSIKALMSAYGIPNTLLSIREYGGPKVEQTSPKLTEERFAYALRMDSNSTIKMQRNYLTSSLGTFSGGNRPPDTTEIRFKPAVKENMSLLSVSSDDDTYTYWNVVLEHTASFSGSSDYGRLAFGLYKSAGVYDMAYTNYVPLYNGNWWNVRIWTNSPFTSSTNIPIYIQTAMSSDVVDSKVLHVVSASVTSTAANGYQYWASSSNRMLTIGGLFGGVSTPNDYMVFSGSVQEYREWMEPLTQDAFNEHVLNPTSYVGNSPTSSYDTLVRHYPLGSDTLAYDHTVKLIISSSHPNQNILDFSLTDGNTYATASGFPNNPPLGDHYNRIVETYHIATPSIGASNIYSQKIRLESNRVVSALDPITRSEISAFDTAPVDSNKLGLFFSPQDQINKDIFNQIGEVDVDDYFGSPADEFEQSYPQLVNFTQNYWKKYSTRNDLNAYIRIFSLYDFSLFSQIKQLLPARVNARMGVLIEPSIFERSKVQVTKRPEISNPQYDAVVSESVQQVDGEFQYYTGSIDNVSTDISAESLFKPDFILNSTYEVDYSAGDSLNLIDLNYGIVATEYNPYGKIRLTVAQLQSLYANDIGLYNYLGLPYPITSPVWIDQPVYNYYTSNSLNEYTTTLIDRQRSSYYFDRVVYHYSSSAYWATSSYDKGLDIAISKSLGKYYSKSLEDADYRDDLFAGYAAINYEGSRLTGLDFNVNSTQTSDGGPVVSFTIVNPTTFKVSTVLGGTNTFNLAEGFTFRNLASQETNFTTLEDINTGNTVLRDSRTNLNFTQQTNPFDNSLNSQI